VFNLAWIDSMLDQLPAPAGPAPMEYPGSQQPDVTETYDG